MIIVMIRDLLSIYKYTQLVISILNYNDLTKLNENYLLSKVFYTYIVNVRFVGGTKFSKIAGITRKVGQTIFYITTTLK